MCALFQYLLAVIHIAGMPLWGPGLTCQTKSLLGVLRSASYQASTIQTLRCKKMPALFEETHPTRFRAIETVATCKLAMLEAARTLDFLRSPPSNRLEAFKGDRAGQWSIRINDLWRMCFAWIEAGPVDVEIVDDH